VKLASTKEKESLKEVRVVYLLVISVDDELLGRCHKKC